MIFIGFFLEVLITKVRQSIPVRFNQVKRHVVKIANVFTLQSKVLLLDEPFGRLDSLTRMELQDVISNILEREKLTAMIVTHDVD